MTKWTYNEWTISDFQKEAATIDCNPEWQRADVDTLFHSSSTPSKAQSIIASILQGLDIGEIKLCKFGKIRASIDGGNRKRAILAFINNKFPLHRKSEWKQTYFKDLSKDLQDMIWDYTMRVIIYDAMPSRKIGLIFRTTNTVTPVNQQEMRNSYGDDPLATLIRRTVRVIPDVGNTTHQLFAIKGRDKDGLPRYRYLAFNNKRLRMEDQVARIVHRIINNETPGVSPDNALNAMYDTIGPMWKMNPIEQIKTEKKLKNALDFFLKVSSAASNHNGGRGLTIGQFSLLTRIYFYMKSEYDTFKVNNYEDFWKDFIKAFKKIEKRRDLVNLPNGQDDSRTVGEAFGGYLSFDRHEDWKYQASIDWLLEEFDPLDYITVKDSKRCFSAKEIEDCLIDQNWTDYIDGKPLNLKNAVGAHKTAHSLGGRTNQSNLVVISAMHNAAMGSMDVDSYKEWFLRTSQRKAS